jgi:hypothetical protein
VDVANGIEVRGTHNQEYPQESLNILSQLWNDPDPRKIKDFDWQEIIETKELLDEQEFIHYQYRKDKNNYVDSDDEQTEIKNRKERSGNQVNSHLKD